MATKKESPMKGGPIDQHKKLAMGMKVTGQTLKKGGKVEKKAHGGRGC